jgi:hypothetical protein
MSKEKKKKIAANVILGRSIMRKIYTFFTFEKFSSTRTPLSPSYAW